jgi:quercetin dioxygenase-like cupin family protein
MKSISLDALADEKLARARHSRNGRAAYTVHGGHDHALKQTVVALAKGHRFREDGGLGEATLPVLRGRVRLTTVRDTWEGVSGDQLTIPSQRHSPYVPQDLVILLTVLTDQNATPPSAAASSGAKVQA